MKRLFSLLGLMAIVCLIGCNIASDDEETVININGLTDEQVQKLIDAQNDEE